MVWHSFSSHASWSLGHILQRSRIVPLFPARCHSLNNQFYISCARIKVFQPVTVYSEMTTEYRCCFPWRQLFWPGVVHMLFLTYSFFIRGKKTTAIKLKARQTVSFSLISVRNVPSRTTNDASIPQWEMLCSAFIIYCQTAQSPAVDSVSFGPLRDQLTVTG